jgi:hypothetical protein
MNPARALLLVAFAVPSLGIIACGSSDEPYKPTPAFSGRKASLPPVPQLPTTPVKAGDGYTVYGAIHHMRSRIHNTYLTTKNIAITGYIIDSNIPTAPSCAVHKTGKKDPEGCTTEIPTFVIADTKGADPKDPKIPKIKVMGWASNFANVHDAMEKYKPLKEAPTEKQVWKDEVWGMEVPWPLPAVGAKVKITGKYGVNFAKSSAGIAADPLSGIMTYAGPPDSKIEVLEPAPEPAAFGNDTAAPKKK